MKLNYKQTILIGFAFFSISAFWQMYNNVIPLILTETFHMNETLSGAIMAADNVLALFLLPLFGALSDRSTAKSGRRMPFIVWGTVAAVALMMLLPIFDNLYYVNHSGAILAAFVVILGLLLVAMGTYRSPAVALMPDCTPKPLRSKGNAIINLMGALGGIIYLLFTSVMYSGSRTAGMEHISYVPLFAFVGALMLISVTIVKLTVNENKLSGEVHQYELDHPDEVLAETDAQGKEVLPKEVKRSLFFLLLSVALWYMGYNAVTTWFTAYASKVWNMPLGTASMCLTIAMAGAIVSYLPTGMLGSKFGRKKCILFGCFLLAGSFAAAWVLTQMYDHFTPLLYIIFVTVGIAWAFICVHSLPMVVEMCSGSDTGKFTGYYYTFSMAAQSITPIISGFLMNKVSYSTLFPYSALFVIGSIITMSLVRHGDIKIDAPKGLDAFDIDD